MAHPDVLQTCYAPYLRISTALSLSPSLSLLCLHHLLVYEIRRAPNSERGGSGDAGRVLLLHSQYLPDTISALAGQVCQASPSSLILGLVSTIPGVLLVRRQGCCPRIIAQTWHRSGMNPPTAFVFGLWSGLAGFDGHFQRRYLTPNVADTYSGSFWVCSWSNAEELSERLTDSVVPGTRTLYPVRPESGQGRRG